MRETSPYAGKKVRLRADTSGFGGQKVEVVDWYVNAAGMPWREALEQEDPKADGYNIRRGLGGLPDDDDVLIGRVDGVMQLVHRTEIEGETATEPTAARAPKLVDKRAVGESCPACKVRLDKGDLVAVVVLGPGANPDARAKARNAKSYEAVAIEIHWACATGEEPPAPDLVPA